MRKNVAKKIVNILYSLRPDLDLTVKYLLVVYCYLYENVSCTQMCMLWCTYIFCWVTSYYMYINGWMDNLYRETTSRPLDSSTGIFLVLLLYSVKMLTNNLLKSKKKNYVSTFTCNIKLIPLKFMRNVDTSQFCILVWSKTAEKLVQNVNAKVFTFILIFKSDLLHEYLINTLCSWDLKKNAHLWNLDI